MTKKELALQYFPQSSASTAVRHLSRWISRCHPLVEALAKTGYQNRHRSFTWRQVLLIHEFLGRPIDPEEPFPPSFPLDGHKRT